MSPADPTPLPLTPNASVTRKKSPPPATPVPQTEILAVPQFATMVPASILDPQPMIAAGMAGSEARHHQQLQQQQQQPSGLLHLPTEIQVHMLTYLRAYDLSVVQRTCRHYNQPDLIHKVVQHIAEYVYTPEMTQDFCQSINPLVERYNLAHLRHMELAIVARIISSPEPQRSSSNGFYISKGWIKKTLLWLEKVHDDQATAAAGTPSDGKHGHGGKRKKLSKKQQRQRSRRLSDVQPPWPDANGDILCTHSNLQRYSNAKSARSRRRLLDKQAWKILKKLYPESTTLNSLEGECLHCLVETETARRTEQQRLDQLKLERKKPLSNPFIRRFYTRAKGVPVHCLRQHVNNAAAAAIGECPLIPGTYYIVPRAWCHRWRKYIKTGEGSKPLPPDASSLLCDGHRLALLPPHLEQYVYGETVSLLSTARIVDTWKEFETKQLGNVASLSTTSSAPFASEGQAQSPARNANPRTGSPMSTRGVAAGSTTLRAMPVGMAPGMMDAETARALQMAGMSPMDLAAQQMALLQLERRRQQQQQHHQQRRQLSHQRSSESQNELLDRENHIVVEILTQEEWTALHQTGAWSSKSHSPFGISFTVHKEENECVSTSNTNKEGKPRSSVSFSTSPCRSCDASAKTAAAKSSMFAAKNRSRSSCTSSSLSSSSSSSSNGRGSSGFTNAAGAPSTNSKSIDTSNSRRNLNSSNHNTKISASSSSTRKPKAPQIDF